MAALLRGRVQDVLKPITRQQIQERRSSKFSAHVTAPTCTRVCFTTILNISKSFLVGSFKRTKMLLVQIAAAKIPVSIRSFRSG